MKVLRQLPEQSATHLYANCAFACSLRLSDNRVFFCLINFDVIVTC